MTLPQTGNFGLVDVRDKALRDTGSIQLTSNRTRDFYRNKSNPVTLSSCRNFAWSAGRTKIAQSQATSVRPFHAATGTDGSGSKSQTVNLTEDRVIWTPRVYGTVSNPGASYMSSFFYADAGHNDFTLSFKMLRTAADQGGGSLRLDWAIQAYRDGYISGPVSVLHSSADSATNTTRTHAFTVPSDKRFVLISWGAWLSGSGAYQNSQYTLRNLQVNHR